MRNFKKISAIFVVIAMMLTMVSFTAFADTEFMTFNAASSVKAGTDVAVDVYMIAGEYSSLGITVNTSADITAEDVNVDITGLSAVINPTFARGLNFSFADMTGVAPLVIAGEGSVKVATITVTAPSEEGSADLITIVDGAVYPQDPSLDPITVATTAKATVTVSAPWDIAGQEAVTKTVGFGTADPELPASITVNNGAGKSETREVEWDLANDYSATTVGAQTISGTIKADESKLGVIGDFVAEATVTVNPVTVEAGDIVLPDDGYILMYSEDIADLAAVAASLPTSYEVSVTVDEETFTAMVPVTWTAALNEANAEATAPYEVGTLFDLTGALTAGPIADTVFTVAADQTIATTVEITPAEVVGSSIAVEMKGYTQKPEVTVTLPANTLYIVSTTTEGEGEDAVTTVDYGTITVTFTGEGDDPVTGTATYEVTEEDYLANTGEGAAAVELTAKATDYLKTMGFQVGDSITVTADYEGAAILSGETEEGGAEKAESFVVKSVITGGGSQVGGAGATGAVKNYLINVAEATNGTVAVSKDNAAKGTVITVTTTPAEGYKTEKITVKDKDGIDIPVDQDAKTFTMPGKDVTVSATFVEGEEVVAPVETTYTDVTEAHWAYEAIEALAAAGIVNGNPDGTFAPDNAITRAELTKMIVNVFGVEATSLETGFVDCPADAWFTPYVAAAKEAGYVTGVSETEFAPEALVTREQACAILGRALNATSETALTFTDAASVEAYAVPYVAALVDLGIVNGYADGSFAPANSITRAEAAKIIAGAMAIIEAIEAPVEEEAAEEVATEEATEEAAEETTEEVVEEEAADAVVEEEATEEAAEETTEEVVDEK